MQIWEESDMIVDLCSSGMDIIMYDGIVDCFWIITCFRDNISLYNGYLLLSLSWDLYKHLTGLFDKL